MLETEIGKMQAETTGRTTETKPLIAIPSSMGADSEPHPPMPGIGLEMKCTQDVMGLCACPKPDCAPIGNKNVSCCYFCDFLKIPLLKPQHQCFSLKRNYCFIMITLISTTNSMPIVVPIQKYCQFLHYSIHFPCYKACQMNVQQHKIKALDTDAVFSTKLNIDCLLKRAEKRRSYVIIV